MSIHEEILKKQKVDINHLIVPIKLTTVKKYLKRLQELKKEAFFDIVCPTSA